MQSSCLSSLICLRSHKEYSKYEQNETVFWNTKTLPAIDAQEDLSSANFRGKIGTRALPMGVTSSKQVSLGGRLGDNSFCFVCTPQKCQEHKAMGLATN